MTANEIRRSFLAYFERQGHRVVPSSSLVPHEDPTLLFTNAGMNQFKGAFLGTETRAYTRATSAQKCMRVSGKHNDLDNVGPSLRHHTFFEMLGNFSFGDYFKADAIPLAWSLLTEQWRLPKDRLYATVFRGEAGVPRDDEAFDIWRGFVPADHIGELGAADNFWQMGDTGPCGRCSEIYYFRGAEVPCPHETAGRACRGLECDCDRFIEVWNNVFMEFNRQPDGALHPLPARSIDTGMGLERITAVLQGTLSNYDTDLFTPILAAIGQRAGTTHRGTMAPADVSMRVVADHLRAMTFLIADGVTPSNEWRGYVLRKIMRRAMRHGKRLGVHEPFLFALVDVLVTEFGDAYPEISSGRDAIAQVIRSEEERFDAVLTDGLPRLEEALDAAAAQGGVLAGDVAFRLYDTFGLPRDFIEDMVEDRKLALDRTGFDRAMEAQRQKARAGSAFKSGPREATAWEADPAVRSQLTAAGDVFEGYTQTRVPTQVLALFDDSSRQVPSLADGASGFAALATSPFYLESGGQVSDIGTLTGPAGQARVTGLVRVTSWPRLHAIDMARGALHVGDAVTAAVAEDVRAATRRHHTATHLLHAALRQVLGPHVKQAGSLVAPDRLRFDFHHPSAVTHEHLLAIERLVNEQVLKNTPVNTEVKPTQEAMASGAMALFGEKYGETVRVVSIPGFSMELCGGTHVKATGEIGLVSVLSESGVAAGVRRIEATAGLESMSRFQRDRDALADAAALLNVRPGEVTARIAAIQDESKRLVRELQQARMRAALAGNSTGASGDGGSQSTDQQVAGITLVAQEVSGLDKAGLRALVDRHRDRIKTGVVVLAAPSGDKVSLVVGVTPDLTTRVAAGAVVKQLAVIVGGGGGGRPDFAEAGGKDPSKIGEMLAASREVVGQMLTA